MEWCDYWRCKTHHWFVKWSPLLMWICKTAEKKQIYRRIVFRNFSQSAFLWNWHKCGRRAKMSPKWRCQFAVVGAGKNRKKYVTIISLQFLFVVTTSMFIFLPFNVYNASIEATNALLKRKMCILEEYRKVCHSDRVVIHYNTQNNKNCFPWPA